MAEAVVSGCFCGFGVFLGCFGFRTGLSFRKKGKLYGFSLMENILIFAIFSLKIGVSIFLSKISKAYSQLRK
jgi:hypothetical protein